MKFLNSLELGNLQVLQLRLENLPTISTPVEKPAGAIFFDSSLGVPKFSDGTSWKVFGKVYTGGAKITVVDTVINHDEQITTPAASTAAPGYAGTFTAIDSVTYDAYGHATGYNLKTITMPSEQSIPADMTATDAIKIASRVIKHDVAVVANTTNAASVAHSGTFTAIDTITKDSWGHVTTFNTKTITMPAIYEHPTGDGYLHVIATSTTNNGKFLMAGATAGALSWGVPTDTTYTASKAIKLVSKDFQHDVTIVADTTNTAAPGYGGTFTAVDSVTRDSYGHTTTINTKTVTMPTAQSIPTALKSPYALTLKINGATVTEGTNLYTYDGSIVKELDFVAGTNVTLTPTAGKVTISSAFTDTKNTAGSTDSATKIFLIGATTQGANPQTYSNSKAYITDGVFNTTSITTTGAISAGTSLSSGTSTAVGTSLTVGTTATITGALTAASINGVTFITADPSSSSTDLTVPTSKAVNSAIGTAIAANAAMVYKGTIGTGGTFAALPTTGVKVGDTWKIITAGTYASVSASVGDMYIATATTPVWSYVPSGDERETALRYTTTIGSVDLTTNFQTGNLTLGSAVLKLFTTDFTATNSDNDLPTSKAVVEYNNMFYIKGTDFSATTPITVTHTAGTKTVGGKIVIAHAASGVTAAIYGPTANASPTHSGTFIVPTFTVNSLGHLTAGADRTITLPAAYSLTAANIRGLIKFSTQNPVLTQAGGICTWTIPNSLATADVTVSIVQVADGEEVYADITKTASNIVIKIVAASLLVNTYRATIIG